LFESTPGFFDAAVAEGLADFEGGGESLPGEFVLAQAEVSDAAEMEAVGFSPGVLAVGRFRAVERVAGVLEGFMGVTGGEVGFGQGEAEVDGVFSEAAGVGEEDAGFGFGDGLGEVVEVTIQFGGGVEAAELELDIARAVGEGAGLLKVLGRLGGILRKEEYCEESMTAAEVGVVVVGCRELTVGLRLAECPESVTAKKPALRLPDPTQANHGFSLKYGGSLKVSSSCFNFSKGEVRRRSKAESALDLGGFVGLRCTRNRVLRVLAGLSEVPRIQLDAGEVTKVD
jgi:hypothetical protein